MKLTRRQLRKIILSEARIFEDDTQVVAQKIDDIKKQLDDLAKKKTALEAELESLEVRHRGSGRAKADVGAK